MPETTESFADNFDRGNGPIGNGWTELQYSPYSLSGIVNLRAQTWTLSSAGLGRNAIFHRPALQFSNLREPYKHRIEFDSVRCYQDPTIARSKMVMGFQFSAGYAGYKPKFVLELTRTSWKVLLFWKNSSGTFQLTTIASGSFADIGVGYITNFGLEIQRTTDWEAQTRTYRVFLIAGATVIDQTGTITNFQNMGLSMGAEPTYVFAGMGDTLLADAGPDFLDSITTFANTSTIQSEWNDFIETVYAKRVYAFFPIDDDEVIRQVGT